MGPTIDKLELQWGCWLSVGLFGWSSPAQNDVSAGRDTKGRRSLRTLPCPEVRFQ